MEGPGGGRTFFIAKKGDDYDNPSWVPPHPDNRPATGYFVDRQQVTKEEYDRLHAEWHADGTEPQA